MCRTSPQLWRIENIIGEDCFQYFSYPGYFFEEWLKSEIIKQELRREQRKREKAIKKQQKKERKKIREELGLSFKPRNSEVEGRPRSLLSKDGKETNLPQPSDSVRVQNSEDHQRASRPAAEGFALGAARASDASDGAIPTKKSGLSAVFGFLSKEKGDAMVSPASYEAEQRSGSGEMKGSERESSERKRVERDRRSVSMDVISRKLLHSGLKDNNHDSIAGSNFRGSSHLSSVGLFEQIPTQTFSSSESHYHTVDRYSEVKDTAPNLLKSSQENQREEDDEIGDPFSLIATNRHYQTNTKLGKYLTNKRLQENNQNPSRASVSPSTLLLSKKPSSDRIASSAGSPVAISLLPTSSSPTPSSAMTENYPSSGGAKARKRNSVIFNPNLLSTMTADSHQHHTSKGQDLVESLRADVLNSALGEGLKLTTVREDDEEADEEHVSDMDDFRDVEDEEIISSSKPFAQIDSETNKASGDYDDDEPSQDPDDADDNSPVHSENSSEVSSPPTTSGRGVPPPPPPPPPPPAAPFASDTSHRPPPPPPPPAPPKERIKASIGDEVLATIRTGATSLKRVEREERVVDMRTKLLSQIKEGGAKLKTVQVQSKKINTAMQNAAVAAILANRSKIAGSDSESDSDDDSVFTDDDYG